MEQDKGRSVRVADGSGSGGLARITVQNTPLQTQTQQLFIPHSNNEWLTTYWEVWHRIIRVPHIVYN